MPYRISRLGLVEVRSLDLDRDLDYYLNVLGLQLTAREGKTAYMKGWDERHAYSFALTESDRAGMVRMAFRTVDPEDLDYYEKRLKDAQPGGNVTGITLYAGGGALFGKFVELLRELVPSLRTLGVLWGYAPPSYRPEQVAPATEELHRAAKALNVNVRFWQTGTESDLGSALAAAESAPLDALFVTAGVIHGLPDIAPRIARFVLQRRLPALTDFPGPLFDAGVAVMAYSTDAKELATRTAYFVDRILKGAKPGELPIEQPTRYRLTVNLKTAKALSLTIPQSLLLRADRLIE